MAYPKNSLIDALKVSESIRDYSAGKPFDRLDLAKSLDYSPGSSGFRTLIYSSTRYGLSTGSYASQKIALTPLGISIMFPKGRDEKAEGLKEALFNIDIYKQFFTDYDNKKLPPVEYLTNTLNRDYGIPIEDAQDCYDMIVKNARELNILDNISGSDWIHMSKLVSKKTSKVEKAQPIPEAELTQETKDEEKPNVEPEEDLDSANQPIVFISHSKNKKIVEQIKQILTFGQFDYVIAEETETTAIPIPEKIFGLMKKCNCAIINVSADEKEKRADGTYGINSNVLIEIGAAFLKYNKRIILLVDKRLKLPSNLQGLYRSEYEGDELTFTTAMKLQKALIDFRKN